MGATLFILPNNHAGEGNEDNPHLLSFLEKVDLFSKFNIVTKKY